MSERFILAAGTTQTASIDGISAAGADPALLPYTPSADADLLVYGRPVRADTVPVSPTGCPTPAVVTRAVHECIGLDPLVVDAGLARPTAAPTVDVGARPGGDIRADRPVPGAHDVYESARSFATALPDDHLVIGETIPGGTTTALGVLTALGAGDRVSSTLPENPLELKRSVVASALENVANPDPLDAVVHAGDPVLATVAGLATGALERDARVTLAGGTQQLAVAALLRNLSFDDPVAIATTPYVAADPSAGFRETAAALGLDVTVVDPGFADTDHPGLERYAAGEGKEGVGMGGALALADAAGVEMQTVRDRVVEVYDRVIDA